MRILILAPILAASLLAAPVAAAADLNINLSGIRAQTGIIKVAVVDSEAGWDGTARPVHATGGPPSGETRTFSFEGLAPGTYAVMVTHDENGNGKLDTNALGMPLEGYGFSNNPRVMRKPTFEESRFTIGTDHVIVSVELR